MENNNKKTAPESQEKKENAKQERKPDSKRWPSRNGNRSKSKNNPSPDEKSGNKGCTGNALAWHNKYGDLFAMATHISQFKLAGKQVTPTAQSEYVALGNRISVYKMAITPGTVIGTGDPFNKAMIDLFNKVRGKYTSTIPFQANDLGTVVLAVANIISLIAAMDRVLDNLGFVSYKSSLTPEILHAALVGDVNNATIKAGYDSDVYQSPNLKLALEVQILRLQGLFMPKMSLFDFAGWIYRHVYFEDETQLRGDMTLFRPAYIAKWSPTVAVVGASGVYASGLVYEDINSYLVSPNPHSAEIYLRAITACIDALVQDDSVRTICGWLHQYVPDSPTITDLVQSTRQSVPEKNKEMDLFIAGLTCIQPSNFVNTNVQQDVTNECLYFTMSPYLMAAPITQWLINYEKQPTDEEVGLSLIFTALYKDGYVYSDPFVAVAEDIYHRTAAGVMNVYSNHRHTNAATATAIDFLLQSEGRFPTTLIYTLSSGGAVNAATLYAPCEFQVPITPENAYNVHYASISSLLTVEQTSRDAR